MKLYYYSYPVSSCFDLEIEEIEIEVKETKDYYISVNGEFPGYPAGKQRLPKDMLNEFFAYSVYYDEKNKKRFINEVSMLIQKDICKHEQSILEDKAKLTKLEFLKQSCTLLALAKKLSREYHEGQFDRGGKPYYLHPAAVADMVKTPEQKIVAYLHDTLEDTELTKEKLKNLGFPDNIVTSVWLLTHRPHEPYDWYLSLLKEDETARIVKLADLKHNSDISRIPNPTEKDYERLEKYKKAIEFLES